MSLTSLGLLARLRSPSPDQSDWARLRDIYLPLIRSWLRRIPGLSDEADDISQEVFMVVVRKIPGFERQRDGSFRAWLRRISVNQIRAHRTKKRRRLATGLDPTEGFLDQLADPKGELARKWDIEHDRHVCPKLLNIVQGDFQATTWEAFRLLTIEGISAAEVAQRTGQSVDAVVQAKSRILKRLRQEAGNLLD